MSELERIASNTPWEPVFGYARAVRAGQWLLISGTTATDERGMLLGSGQMYVQARQALANLKRHVESAGLSLRQVARTRVYVTDISRFAEVARAHREALGEFPPASTCVEVRKLVHPDMLVEIEADVYAGASETAAAPQRAIAKPAAKASKPAQTPAARKPPKAKPVPPRKSSAKSGHRK